MPGTAKRILEILVIEPRDLSETPQAIQALRERKIVILKLSEIQCNQAQRAVDLVTGGTYAIHGHTKRIGEQTFLFAPKGVQIN